MSTLAIILIGEMSLMFTLYKRIEMEKDNWELFIDSCIEDDNIKACKTSKEIHDVILTELKKSFGSVSVGKLDAIADDATESICLRIGLPQT
jgi:hypothetical protein